MPSFAGSTRRSIISGLAGLLGSSLLSPARADFPERTIRILIGFGAGGNIDALGRIIADQLAKDIGKPVIVENKAGAGGNVAATFVASSEPDGYTLLLGGTNYLIGRSWFKNLQFDITRDLTVLTTLSRNSNVLVVNPDSKLRTLDDVIKQARERPTGLTFGSSGVGTLVHLAGELFKSQARVDLRHIPYTAVSPAEVDLMAGRIDMMFDTLPTALPFIEDGRLRAIGVTSAQRSSFAPAVPTLSELGLKGYDATSWYAIWMPAAVHADISSKLKTAFDAALSNPEVQARVAKLGGEIFNPSAPETRTFIKDELSKWTSTVEALGPR